MADFSSDTLDTRSEEVQELISKPPRLLVRWGITIMFFIIFLFAIISWFFKYPDVVEVSLLLTTAESPKSVNAKIGGRLMKLFVKEGQSVKEGDVLGYLESITDYDEVVNLSKNLKSIKPYMREGNIGHLTILQNSTYSHLGELQADYQKLIQSYIELKSSAQNSYSYQNKLTFKNELRNNFIQSFNILNNAIETWKYNYILAAPTSGQISFTSIIQEKQFVLTSQEILFVSPRSDNYFGTAKISQNNLGKIKVGQAALIKFNSYPFQEFGTVDGIISEITEVPAKDSTFLAKIVLPKGLKTNYGKKLVFKNSMSATAEIITEDRRLIERFFYGFRKTIVR